LGAFLRRRIADYAHFLGFAMPHINVVYFRIFLRPSNYAFSHTLAYFEAKVSQSSIF